MKAIIPQTLYNTVKSFTELQPAAKFILVGGAIRDYALGLPINDFDIELFQCTPDQFKNTIEVLGIHWKQVGKDFPVFQIYVNDDVFDIAFPRTERKNGVGYKGFEITINPFLSFKDAAERRDLTINSIMYDILEDKIIDPFNGLKDLQEGNLRATSEKFKEDPLRVLRVMQFMSRFNFKMTSEIHQYAKFDLRKEKDALVPERVWGEWKKLLLKGQEMKRPLSWLWQIDWLESELDNLTGVEQNPEYHPEGTALEHTLYVFQEAKNICNREGLNEDDTIILMLAALCHDLGKATTTIINDKGNWTSPGHAEAGVELTESFLNKINCPLKYRESIKILVALHMIHIVPKITRKFVRKTVNKLVDGGTTLKMLALLVEADMSGRPPLPKHVPQNITDMLEIFSTLNISFEERIAPLLTGKDLIKLGFQQGPIFKKILDEVYELQLSDEILTHEQAIEFVSSQLSC